MPRLICLILGHRRSRSRARFDGATWRSSCRRCRVAMAKEVDGRWHMIPPGGAVAVPAARSGD